MRRVRLERSARLSTSVAVLPIFASAAKVACVIGVSLIAQTLLA
jgi:hypothetical protein